MKKFLVVILLSFIVFGFTSPNAVTLRYYNKDSQTHTFPVKIAGSSKSVTFEASRTSSVTIQGGSNEAVISCNCGDVKVSGGDNIEIKDGCITVK